MNIFKALSQGDGRINETNVTSFLSFICNESTEFSAAFLILFLEEINHRLNESLFDIEGKTYRQKIENFKNKYSYSAQPEYRVEADKQRQDLDVLIIISDKNSESDYCYLLIENKIKKTAYKEGQCQLQYELFKKTEDLQSETPIISVLISPNDPKFEGMINAVKSVNPNSVWLKWETTEEKSLVELFRILIQLESKGEIAPIQNNTQYILKSFIDYISTELDVSDKKLYNHSIAGSKVIDQCEFIRNNKQYFLKRYDNNMVRIFDEENNEYEGQVKPILREIIETYNLNVPLTNREGVKKPKKDTRILGRDVIIAMKNIK